MERKRNSIAALVLSCDKYSPYWDGWHFFWSKHWKPAIPVYFATEAKKLPSWPGITPLYVGRDMTWSGCLFMALSKIKEDTVFFSLEDYWARMDIGKKKFSSLYQEFMDRDLLCLRCSHDCDKFYDFESDGTTFSDKSKFLISCQTSLWNKHFLMRIIDITENAWQFECLGTRRVREYGLAGRFAFHRLPWYNHVCVRGRFLPEMKCILNHTTLSVPPSLNCSQIAIS